MLSQPIYDQSIHGESRQKISDVADWHLTFKCRDSPYLQHAAVVHEEGDQLCQLLIRQLVQRMPLRRQLVHLPHLVQRVLQSNK